MSPRERAKACWHRLQYEERLPAWLSREERGVVLPDDDGFWVRVQPRDEGAEGLYVGPFPTEDEALTHALLLRDVVLS